MLVLVAMRVSASGVEAQPVVRKPRLRAVTVSGRVEEVRVAARTATRLRFDTALDAGRTRLHDEHGRFEPLVLGNDFLVVTPREEVPEGEQVTLQVVLADGTRLPFVLATRLTEVDVQVRVVRREPSRPALVSTAWREHVRGLREGRAEWPARPRAREGEGRAGRLAEVMLELAGRSGRVSSEVASAVWRPGAGLETERRLFHAGGLSGFMVRVRNPDPLRPWEPGEVRVRHAAGRGEVEVQALRMEPVSLPPGGWGWLVVVTGALPRDEGARFELELRGRGGARQAPPEGVAL
ncbi:DUF2381 family protein [Archangium sp.]|jgi:uncharacterized protein (TIGR02268 family)|uniref:DUF2381 family protein n=1 Tax=Archangium sp. TaxID=1872627 RepID=UPI002ED89D07